MITIKVSKKKGGGGAMYHAVERKAPNGSINLFATKEDIVDIGHRTRVAGQTIKQSYKLAYSAPNIHYVSHNMLLGDIGFKEMVLH
jgi:hypothetical protein